MTRMNRPRNKHSGVVVVVVGDTFITPSSNSSGRPSSSGHSTAEAFSSFDDDCDRRPPPPPLAKGKGRGACDVAVVRGPRRPRDPARRDVVRPVVAVVI
jgi:hypothetical protein